MSGKRLRISPGLRFSIYRRDGFRCTYCGIDALVEDIALEIDHIIPVSAGGTNDPANLTTACRACNWNKGPKRPRVVENATRVVITMPSWMDERIGKEASRTFSSRSQVIRRLLAFAIEQGALEVAP